MTKAVVIILSVAILGFLGLNAHSKNSQSPSTPSSASSQSEAPPISSSATTSRSTATTGANYKDGNYTGAIADTPYGTVQVEAVVSGGKIADIKLLQMPYLERESSERSGFSGPILKQEAIAAQSSKIDFVSGATSTSDGFSQSLQAALDQAASA
jgi:uncharacterized protein with FMN-binding domain